MSALYQRYPTGFTGLGATRIACVSGVSPSSYQRYSANISSSCWDAARSWRPNEVAAFRNAPGDRHQRGLGLFCGPNGRFCATFKGYY